MYKKILLIIGSFLLSAMFGTAAMAQYTVEGTVSDQNAGVPLPGATVILVDADFGTATNVDGEFEFSNVPEGTYTLRITYVGYVQLSRTIEVNQDLNLNLALQQDDQALGEVVVTGYGSIVREQMTGNVSSISARQLKKFL